MLFILALFVYSVVGIDTLITTTDGPILGNGGIYPNVVAFLGVPYADPPVGALRWKPTQPNTAWTATRPTMFWGAQCYNSSKPGVLTPGVDYPNGVTWSEDCLFLDIYVPNTTTTNKSVLVWIHGGALKDNGAAAAKYHGFSLAAKEDIIVVSINYRLGLLGFMALPELRAEDAAFPSSGNYGFMDQITALNWIKANIDRFGGNVDDITVGGESAGGASVAWHLQSARSPTFNKAVLASPPIFFEITTFTTNAGYASQSLTALSQYIPCASNRTDPTTFLECLRAVPASLIVQFAGPYSFATIDGYFFVEHPLTAFNNARYKQIPTLVLNDRDEGTVFFYTSATPLSEANYTAFLTTNYGSVFGPVVKDFYGACSVVTGGVTDCRAQASASFGDSGLICPGVVTAQMINQHSSNVRYFVFSYQPSYTPSFYGVGHTFDLYYYMNNLPYANPFANALEVALARNLSSYFGAWIKGDDLLTNPNLPVAWPLYEFPARTSLSIQGDGTFQTINLWADEHCYLWKLAYSRSTPDPTFVFNITEPFNYRPNSSAVLVPSLFALVFSVFYRLFL